MALVLRHPGMNKWVISIVVGKGVIDCEKIVFHGLLLTHCAKQKGSAKKSLFFVLFELIILSLRLMKTLHCWREWIMLVII